MIVLIGGEKGGTGKSTIATNLAVALSYKEEDILIVDCDPQCTASKWVNRRNKNLLDMPKVYCIEKTGNIFDTVQDVAKRYRHVLIDAGGRDSEELRTGMVACDKMYIPLKASQPDIETGKHMSQLLKLAKGLNSKLVARAIISMASTNPVLTEDREAIELLSKLPEIEISSTIIRERKIYRDAMADGKGVVEYNNLKAKEEVNNLYREIFL